MSFKQVPTYPYTLASLDDVLLTSPSTGEVLTYNGTKWVNNPTAGLVTSVSNTDSTLSITPTTGAVVASLNLGHANTWTAAQTFDSSDLLLFNPAGTFAYTFAGAAIAAGRTITLPLLTGADTLATIGFAQTWTALQKFTNADFAILGSSTGYTLLESGLSGSGNNTLTLPTTTTDTLAALGTAQSWTAVQTFANNISIGGVTFALGTLASGNLIQYNGTNWVNVTVASLGFASLGVAQTWTALQKFTNGDLALLGSSTGYTLLESGLSGGSNNTLTLPTTAADTLAALGTAQTFSAAQSFTLAFPTYNNISTEGVFKLTTVIGDAIETELTTTSPTAIKAKTPAAAGNYLVFAYFRVVTAATVVTLTVTWTDATGAQTYTWVNAASEGVGSYGMLPLYLDSVASQAITVTATAGTANQVYVSSSIAGF